MIIVKTISESSNMINSRYETFSEMVPEILIYLLTTVISGMCIGRIRKILIKDKIEDNSIVMMQKYLIINENDISKIKEILEIRKENVDLLKNGCNVEDRPVIKRLVR